MPSSTLDATNFLELSVKEAGREVCIADKTIRFTPKRYAVLHYVYAGQGTFTYRGKTYPLHRNQGFLIPAEGEATYSSSSTDPWSYFWIGVGGSKVSSLLEFAGLSGESPVFHDAGGEGKSHFEAIYESYFDHGAFGIDCLGEAYLLFAHLGGGLKKSSSSERGHIQAAKEFIRHNFQFPITITDVSRSVEVSPNYLANLFAKEEGISPKRYLTDVRMEVAAHLLLSDSTPVAEIGRAVGYANPLHFSKAFSAYYGVSPLHFRNQGGSNS